MNSRKNAVALATTAALLTAATPAFAGGEPKNEWPFTRPVITRTPTDAGINTSKADIAPRGEAKNEWPFTRRVTTREAATAPRGAAGQTAPRGEAKNEPPFTVPVVTVVSSGGSSFDWIDAAIGAAVGIGLAVSATGGLVLLRTQHKNVATTS
ncbi:MAG TPA: hypothetical protein VGC78_07710 [Gaiellaceae bacterium]